MTTADLITAAKAAIREAADRAATNNGCRAGSWLEVTRTYLRIADTVIPAETPAKERRKVYMAVYPFGERAMHPYKIYLAEVRAFMMKHDPETRAKALAKEQERVAKKFVDTRRQLQPNLFGGASA